MFTEIGILKSEEDLADSEFFANCCLVGLVVKVSASRAADPGIDSRLRRGDFLVQSYQ